MRFASSALLSVLCLVAFRDLAADPGAPLTADAAYKPAAELLLNVGIGCGGVASPPRDSGDSWAFTAHIGYAGEEDPNPVLVDKRTGKASWASENYHRCLHKNHPIDWAECDQWR